jgi:ribosome biogenesis GTPase
VDQVIGVLAWDPLPSESLLMRWMIVAHTQGVPFICIVNKSDLASYLPEHPLREWMPKYRALGIPCLETSTYHSDVSIKAQLWPFLQQKTTLLVGQSGAGKSSLINSLIPGLNLETRELSEAIGSGRHTTTTTQMYWLDDDKKTSVMDSPGMQSFGVHGLTREVVLHACPDLQPYHGRCRFRNCQHHHEPECAFLEALDRGEIDMDRWDILNTLWSELS